VTNEVIVRRARSTRVGATTVPRRARRASTTALARAEEEVEALLQAIPLQAQRGRGLTRVLRITGGWVIFGVGVIFVILPVIPGTPLVILAAFILAPDVPVFARVLDWSKGRFSHITTGIADVQERFAEDFHRRFAS
jgi:hypothetical protein